MYVNILVQFPWLSDSDDNIFKIISVDKMKSEGYRVVDLQGIFAGEQTRSNLCYGLANVSETEAIEIIEKTEIRVGLHVDQYGTCKIIDLDT